MTSIEEQREQQELFELVLPAFLVASLDQVVREEEDNIMAITEKDSSEGGGATVSSESESSVVSWEIVNRLAEDDLAVDEDSCQDPFSFCWYAVPSVILKVMAEEDNNNDFLYDGVNNNSNHNLIVDELQNLLVFSVRTDRLETILRNKLAFFFSWDDEDVTGGNDQISIDIQFLGTTNTDPTPSPTANTGADPSGAIDPSEPTNNNSNGEGKNKKSANVGLGVALGIGFALIVAITVSILVVRQRRRRTSSDENHTMISKQQQQDLDDDGEQTIQFHNHRRASAPVPGAFPSIHDGIASPSSLMLVTKDSHDDSEHGGFMVFEDPVDAIFEDPVDPEYYEDYADGMDMRPLDMDTPLDPAILEILSSPPGSSKKQRRTLSGTNNNAKEEDPLDVLTSLSFFSPGKTRDNRGGTTTTLSSPNSSKESSELCWISATTGDSLTVADMVMAERTKNRSGKAMPSPAKSYNSSEGTGDSDIWSSEDGDGPRSSLAVGVWEEFEQPDLATKVSSEDEEIWFIDDDEEGGKGGEDHDVSSSAAVQTRGVPQPQSINRGTSDKRLRSPPNNNAAPSINPRVNLVLKEKKIRDWENRHNVNIPPN